MNFPDKIKIRETATRDGFQSWPDFIPTDIKIKLLNALKDAGIKQFETTAFVSPKAVPQMADAAEVMKSVPHEGVIHGALVPNLKGAQTNSMSSYLLQKHIIKPILTEPFPNPCPLWSRFLN
jgi:hydroxymethylglutaryl-CoA lyase